jgi:haloalkane dehalogenase
VKALRTPEERFAGVPGFGYEPRYADVGDPGEPLRMAYVEALPPGGAGGADAPVVVLLHGEPTWSFLYRTILPVLAAAGLRAVAPDLVGFGRSDKPASPGDHSYARHVEWTRRLLFDALGLRDVTLVGQDWGGLIGLRLVAEHPERFARVVASNTGLPTGETRMPAVWQRFRDVVASAPQLQVSRLVAAGCRAPLDDGALAAYDAPFPSEEFMAGPRVMPKLVPDRPDDPGGLANRAAWASLSRFERPLLCAFTDGDPITAGADRPLRERVPGARGQAHVTIEGGGHFVQEDRGEQLARVVVEFVRATAGATDRATIEAGGPGHAE